MIACHRSEMVTVCSRHKAGPSLPSPGGNPPPCCCSLARGPLRSPSPLQVQDPPCLALNPGSQCCPLHDLPSGVAPASGLLVVSGDFCVFHFAYGGLLKDPVNATDPLPGSSHSDMTSCHGVSGGIPIKDSDKRYQVVLVGPASQPCPPVPPQALPPRPPASLPHLPCREGTPSPWRQPQKPWLQGSTHHAVICVKNWHCLHHQIHTCCLPGTPR